MLFFLLLCALFQPLWSKPLFLTFGTTGSFEAAANLTGVMASEDPTVPDCAGQHLRTVYDIVKTCLFTILACVWTSMHPNINGPRDSWWTCMKRKVITTLYVVILPEFVLLWALYQRFSAKTIADLYNNEFKTLEELKVSIWGTFKQMFQPLPNVTTRRGANVRQPWTTTHGFFIQMGGFILYENEYPKEALTYDRLSQLLREEAIDAPNVTERELQDRSKGNAISKGIVVLQTTWFILQCIVRRVEHLPLSELEVLTLAFAVLNTAIYTAWWNKPQGVDTAICLPMKPIESRTDNFDSAAACLLRSDYHHSNVDQPFIGSNNESTVQQDSWLQHVLRKDRQAHSFPIFLLVRFPYRIIVWIFRLLRKMFAFDLAKTQRGLRMPMFYSAYNSDDIGPCERIAFIIGLIFGAIHLLGWALEFSMQRDRVLWRFCAVALTVAPFVFLISDGLTAWQDVDSSLPSIPYVAFLALAPFYVVARFVVIVVAFKAISHPPHDVLVDISWTRFIPHF